jgi:hypothetical protein
MAKVITATGLKGFMQWLKQDQPAIYKATALQIAKAAPQGFSGFNGAYAQSVRLRRGRASMHGLGSCCSTSCITTCSTETSCAANSGSSTAQTLSAAASVISAASSAVLSQEQQNSYNSLVNSQLQRAQSGLTPLTASSASVGVPTVTSSSSSSSSTGLLLLAAGAAALLFFGSRRRA